MDHINILYLVCIKTIMNEYLRFLPKQLGLLNIESSIRSIIH